MIWKPSGPTTIPSTSSTCECSRPRSRIGPSCSPKHTSRHPEAPQPPLSLEEVERSLQSVRNLEPGGYIELLDPVYPMVSDDGSLSKDSALYRWSSLLNDAATKLGSSLASALSYKKQLTDAGFVNVTESVHKWPMNQWPKLAKHKELGETTTPLLASRR